MKRKMKRFNLTYYLLAILCVVITSCATDGVMDDFPDNKGQALVKDAHISFVLNFPASSSIEDGLDEERFIDDVYVYTFQDDRFIEEVQYLMIDGANGDPNRIVDGKLSGTYDGDTPMEFVVIANARKAGVSKAEMNAGETKAQLYEKLVFEYSETRNWSEYIPMWGIGKIEQVKTGDNNFGELDLIRAVAKVNITVAGGKGLKNFEITEIRLHGYNTEGYCARTGEEGVPSIPSGSGIASGFLTSGPLSGEQGNAFENKFYIPEHKNVEAKDKVYLTIHANVREVAKTYTVQFSTNEKPYNVLRNYLYVFNITSVDEVTASLDYEVKKWEYITVDVPSFN